MTFKERVSKWWHGEGKTYDDPMIIGFYIERHWTSDLAHALVDFYLRHWQWVWGFAVAVAAVYVAYLGLSSPAEPATSSTQ